MRARRGLFVTADAGVYGSSRSLQLLLSRFTGSCFDLVVPKPPSGAIDIRAIEKSFGPYVERIIPMTIPLDNCFVGARQHSKPKAFVIRLAKEWFWFLARTRIKWLAKKNGYDYIHFNSLALNKVIIKSTPSIIHVRELLKPGYSAVCGQLQKAAGIIFIDEVVSTPCRNMEQEKAILRNPCDMRISENSRVPERLLALTKRSSDKVLFAIIGSVKQEKGVLFVIDAFKQASLKSALLLIVGSGKDAYVRKCKDLARDHEGIMFYGEEPDFENVKIIYSLVDYIVRGDSVPREGRTTLEALYAGCGVIIPGGDLGQHPYRSDGWGSKVFQYTTLDRASLITALQEVSVSKQGHRLVGSNVDAYVSDFQAFVDRVLNPFEKS